MSEDLEKSIDKTTYQVFLCTCRAHLPFSFAVHPWFVINNQGDISRYEVRYYKNSNNPDWGHVHKDELPPYSGIRVVPFFDAAFWPGRVRSCIEGEKARKMINIIESTPETYQYRDTYKLSGPNSNTYAQWVLDKSAQWEVELPTNAIGKDFL